MSRRTVFHVCSHACLNYAEKLVTRVMVECTGHMAAGFFANDL